MDDQQIIDLYFDRNEQAITETDAFYFFWTWKLTHKIPSLHRHIEAFFFLDIIGFIHHLNFNLPAVGGVPEADVNRSE